MLTALGLNLPDLVGGLSGGVAVAFAFHKSEPCDIVGSIIVGGLYGNYIAGPLSSMLGTTHGAAAFFAGVVAMPLCKRWVESFKRKQE